VEPLDDLGEGKGTPMLNAELLNAEGWVMGFCTENIEK
jgi:hypothetical protein